MAMCSKEQSNFLHEVPASFDWERRDQCERLSRAGTMRATELLLDWKCEVRYNRGEEDVARKISEEVARQFGVEMSKLRAEFEDLFVLKRRLDAGEVLIVPCEPMEISDFPNDEKERCKRIIIRELEENGDLFPSDIAEKYDLDFDLVLRCVAELKEEQTVLEVR